MEEIKECCCGAKCKYTTVAMQALCRVTKNAPPGWWETLKEKAKQKKRIRPIEERPNR